MNLMGDLREQKRLLELTIRQAVKDFEICTGVRVERIKGELKRGIYVVEKDRPLLVNIYLEEI